jgi:hypothetical protein
VIPPRRSLALVTCAVVLLLVDARAPAQSARPRTDSFASRIERLSERGGTFDTDNLISNERSYLHVVEALNARNVSGGAYIGVGPDQNFSYIAQVRPSIAFIIDIRRDNLLLHLLFKALFALSRTRADYLGLLFGRPPPDGVDSNFAPNGATNSNQRGALRPGGSNFAPNGAMNSNQRDALRPGGSNFAPNGAMNSNQRDALRPGGSNFAPNGAMNSNQRDALRPGGSNTASLERLLAAIDNTAPAGDRIATLRARVDTAIARFGVPLSPEDLKTIDRFHRTFIRAGPALRFQTFGRAPRSSYPTYRELLLETDRSGRFANYLASDEAFQVVQSLQARDLVIPVVGNLAGPHALAAIGQFIAQRDEPLSALYTSNVEFYLDRDDTFAKFLENLGMLPRNARSVIIRSVFGGGYGYLFQEAVPGYESVSLVQPVNDVLTGFATGRFRSYWDLLAAYSGK